MCRHPFVISLLAAVAMPLSLQADVVQMSPSVDAPPSMDAPADEGEYYEPRLKSPEELLQLELPVKGMSMRAVEKKYGPARDVVEPVGEPPITRWIYGNFTVYFEYRYVVHAVLNPLPRKQPQEQPQEQPPQQ